MKTAASNVTRMVGGCSELVTDNEMLSLGNCSHII